METSFSTKVAWLHLGYLGDHLEQGLPAPRWLTSHKKHLYLPLPPVLLAAFPRMRKEEAAKEQ